MNIFSNAIARKKKLDVGMKLCSGSGTGCIHLFTCKGKAIPWISVPFCRFAYHTELLGNKMRIYHMLKTYIWPPNKVRYSAHASNPLRHFHLKRDRGHAFSIVVPALHNILPWGSGRSLPFQTSKRLQRAGWSPGWWNGNPILLDASMEDG